MDSVEKIIKPSVLNQILEDTNTILLLVDRESYKIIQLYPRSFLKKIKSSKEGIIGTNFLNFVHLDDTKKAEQFIESFLKKKRKTNKTIEIRISWKNRRDYQWTQLGIETNQKTKSDDPISITLQDISEKKFLKKEISKKEKKLNTIMEKIPEVKFWNLFMPKQPKRIVEHSYKMLRTVMENIPEYIFWKNKNLEYTGSNNRYIEFLGLKTQDELVGKKNENIKKRKKFLKSWSKEEKGVISSERSQFDTIEKWTHENTDLFLDINRILLRDNKNQIIGLLVTMRDITRSRKAKQQLKESELRYRQLLDTSSVGVIEIDLAAEKINYINPRFQKIVGYQKEDLSFDTMMKQIIHPNDFERIRQKARKASVEFRIITKKDNVKWVNGKRIDEIDKYGNIKGFRLWLEDITERKQYEDLIKELNINFLNFSANTEQNIKSLLDTCNKYLGGTLTLYCFKSIEHENDQYQILTSEGKSYLFTEEEFNQLFISKYYSIDHDFVQNYLNLSNNSYQNTDLFLEKREVKASIGKLIKKEDKITGSICVFFPHNPDFSHQDNLLLFLICDAIEIEQRRWEAQHRLEEQNIVLSKMNKLKNELLSRTSHELKTPLISIKGFTELLLKVHREKFDTDVVSILEEIYDGSKRLEKTILNLLKTSKLDSKKMQLEKTKEDLSFLIKYCVKSLKGIIEMRSQTIDYDLQQNLIVNIDKERIYEVLTNLITNAIKYTQPGGHISIKTYNKDNSAIVSVQDEGIGITEKEKKKLFQKFGKIERYGKGWDLGIEGSGLGLYIAKKIIRLHDGSIWVESEGRHQGSTFYFSIPLSD